MGRQSPVGIDHPNSRPCKIDAMNQYDLVSLQLFMATVDQGNIAAAARSNNIAASAVSKRISDLEARLGVALLYRLRDGAQPTPAGQALYRHAKNIEHILKAATSELSEYALGARGHVGLWASVSAVTQFLPDDIAAFVQSYPEVRIELREDVSLNIVEGVRSGFADVGIYSVHIGSTDLQERVYRRDTLMVIVPKGHELDGRESVRLEEIAAYPQVGLQEGSSLQARLLAEAERLGVPLRLRVHVFGFDGVRGMVAAGLGVAVLPEGAVVPYLGPNLGISALRLDEPWALRTLLIGCRDFASLPVPARELIECLAPALPTGETSRQS